MGRPARDAILYVERDSQKGIVIGNVAPGLDLRVKIAKNWQRDPKQLGRLRF